MTDMEKLEEGLKKLTGLVYEAAEEYVRGVGDSTPIIQLSSKFQMSLAAAALGVNVNDFKQMPLREYARIAARVQRFLLNDSDETDRVPEQLDK